MKKNTKMLLLIVASLLLATGALWAGIAGKLTCQHANCGHKEDVSFGGGRMFEEMTGYCVNCEKFVSLTWARGNRASGGKAEPPKPLGKVWDAATGRTKEVHKCPTCAGLFLPINQDELKHCPKCGKEAQFKGSIHFD